MDVDFANTLLKSQMNHVGFGYFSHQNSIRVLALNTLYSHQACHQHSYSVLIFQSVPWIHVPWVNKFPEYSLFQTKSRHVFHWFIGNNTSQDKDQHELNCFFTAGVTSLSIMASCFYSCGLKVNIGFIYRTQNPRENKVLAKFKCFTVNRTVMSHQSVFILHRVVKFFVNCTISFKFSFSGHHVSIVSIDGSWLLEDR